MDDLAKKLTELLDSPEGLESVMGMAQMLLGSSGAADGEKELLPGEGKKESLPAISAGEIQTIMSMMTAVKGGGGEDDRIRLLLALKPHVNSERCEKIDQAVKILRLTAFLPLLKESGLLL